MSITIDDILNAKAQLRQDGRNPSALYVNDAEPVEITDGFTEHDDANDNRPLPVGLVYGITVQEVDWLDRTDALLLPETGMEGVRIPHDIE